MHQSVDVWMQDTWKIIKTGTEFQTLWNTSDAADGMLTDSVQHAFYELLDDFPEVLYNSMESPFENTNEQGGLLIYRWSKVYELIFKNRKSLMADFWSAVGGVVDADAQIEEAKKNLGETGNKQHAHVKCSLEHVVKVIGVIVRVLSRTVVEVLAEDTIYELHLSLVEVME